VAEDRRFIEESFPVREVSEESAREKNIRHGHISTLHIWWARRPLAASRATAYAALVPAEDDPAAWQKQREFIQLLSKWENSLDPQLLAVARRRIYEAHARRLSAELGEAVTAEDLENGKPPPPRVLDPFAGGGAIPLEALRLGCETCANDYNPVAVLILKATLEYPQKYGRRFEGMPPDLWREGSSGGPSGRHEQGQMELGLETTSASAEVPSDFNPLLAAVKKWGNWVLEEARKELADFYRSPDPDETVVGYIWARTLPCRNPACAAEIPLMRQFWLAKKIRREIALRPVTDGPGGPVRFEIVARGKKAAGQGYAPWPDGYDPSRGTVSRAVVVCPACGATIEAKETRRMFQEGRAGQRMVAVVTTRRGQRGKFYRLPTEADLDASAAAERALAEKRERLMVEWGVDPVPDEPLPVMSGVFNAPIYGMDTWGKLFNPRQQLALITFAERVRRAHEQMLARRYPEDFAQSVAMYLGFVLSRTVDFESSLCHWHPQWEFIPNTFARQALPMAWDFAELNLFSPILTGTWESMHRQIVRAIESAGVSTKPGTVSHASATRLPYPDEHFDAVLTDPPYYNSVPYADLSDFFYVWLKRTVGHLYPDLFATPLTPKGEEITEMAGWDPVRYPHKDKQFFEENLARAFQQIHRVLKPDGVAIIVYAHKSTEGWETVINALLESGLVVSGAWPLNTEMQSRLRANESAALASSIYIVARKVARKPTGFYNEVRQELRRHLDRKLQRLWGEGIGGADFFIAAIGSAIEVFGKYEKVMDYEGNVVRADRLLEEVRVLATDFAVHRILHNGFSAEVSPLTRLYVLWRWEFQEAAVLFDDARKLAQSCGVDLALEWDRPKGFIRKRKDSVVLLGPDARRLEDLEAAVRGANPELVDVLHYALRLWEAGRAAELAAVLGRTGFGVQDVFYRVAQAVAESLPTDSREKKLLEGFLAGRARIQEAAGQKRTIQGEFDFS